MSLLRREVGSADSHRRVASLGAPGAHTAPSGAPGGSPSSRFQTAQRGGARYGIYTDARWYDADQIPNYSITWREPRASPRAHCTAMPVTFWVGAMKPGENLQHLVRTLEQATNNAPNIKVESPKRVPDKDTGKPREHDVVVTFSFSHHSMVMALECRDRSRKVGVPDVEAFRNKCDRTGVHRAIIVSASGFTRTALKKAEALEIGCLGLEEVDRFDWCEAPGVELRLRDLLPGLPWEIGTAEPFDGDPQLYDGDGHAVEQVGFSNMAQAALNLRPTAVAQREDEEARLNPVTCTFVNQGASAFYLIDREGNCIPLTRMVLHVTYRMRYSLIPFSFREYIDHAKGKQLYTAAFATIDEGNLRGDLVVHREPTGIVTVSFVPRAV
jgi:hypothetical protein